MKTYTELGLSLIKDFNIEVLLDSKRDFYQLVVKILKNFSKINFFTDTTVGDNTVSVFFELDGKIYLLYSANGKGVENLINQERTDTFKIHLINDVRSIQEAVLGVRYEQEFLGRVF